MRNIGAKQPSPELTDKEVEQIAEERERREAESEANQSTSGATTSSPTRGPTARESTVGAEASAAQSEQQVDLSFSWSPTTEFVPKAHVAPASIADYVQTVMFRQSQEIEQRLQETAKLQEQDGDKRRAIAEVLKEFNSKVQSGMSKEDLDKIHSKAKGLGIDVSSLDAMNKVLSEQSALGHGTKLGFSFPDNPELNDERQKLAQSFRDACDLERDLVGDSQEERAFKLRKDFNDYGTALEQGNQVQQFERSLAERITIA